MRVRVAYSYEFPPAFLARFAECYVVPASEVRARLKIVLHNVGMRGLVEAIEEYENIKRMDDEPRKGDDEGSDRETAASRAGPPAERTRARGERPTRRRRQD